MNRTTFVLNKGPAVGRYWMVHGPSRGPTSVQHSTLLDALAEAERLAGKHPGEAFYVLSAIAAFRTGTPPVEQLEVV